MRHEKLTVENLMLALEWDYEKNGDLSPENFTAASGKYAWWKCNLGHSWQAKIIDRNNGCNCPYCKGKKVLAGFNDLITTRPQLAAEWDYTKNDGARPEQFSSGSSKKVWWICKYGHSWKTQIHDRSKGNGCPICSNQKVLKGFNDLLSADLDLCLQWDHEKNAQLEPDEVTMNSKRKVWWKCKNGHSWKTSISLRRKGCDCPYCVGKLVIPGKTDLKTMRPKIVIEWDYEKNSGLQPEGFSIYSNKSVWWKCSLGHSWRTAISHRSAGQGCPYCKGRKVWIGFNDLSTTHPQLTAEWDYVKNNGLRPEQFSSGSNKAVWWKCNLGHSWQAMIACRSKGTGCPYCNEKKVLSGFNDLVTTHPKLASEWDCEKNEGVCPEQVSFGSNRKVWWRCMRGHSWKTSISQRSNRECGCPYCSGKLVMAGDTDLKTARPEIAAEWDYKRNGSLNPEKVTPQSNAKVWWICDHGHSYIATICNRYLGRGCPYCCGKRPIVGENDLLTLQPEWLKEWDYSKNSPKNPENYTVSSNIKAWWKCKNGHSWMTQIRDRHAGNRCPYCSGKTPMRTRLVR